jgi:starch phosphorylase
MTFVFELLLTASCFCLQGASPNRPLGKTKKSGSKFDLQQDSSAVLYRPEFKYDTSKKGTDKMWELMSSYLGTDRAAIQRQIVNHVEYTLARTRFSFDNFGAYQAAAYAVRDRLLESWNDTQQYHEANDCKRVYYLSLEFLMGRTF